MAPPDWFRRRPPPATAPAGVLPTVPHNWLGLSAGPFTGASGTDGWTADGHAAQLIAEPVHGGLTAAGLPTRVPRTNLHPGSASGGRPAGSGTGYPAPGYDQQGPATLRSPEVARSHLGGFQSGGRRAMGQTENSAERAG
jgi:hypothetical protein